MRRNTIGQAGQWYICMTEHALMRAWQRDVDNMHIISAISYLGSEKLSAYAKMRSTDVMISDIQHGITIVIAVGERYIRVITVIDNAHCHVKDHEVLETII